MPSSAYHPSDPGKNLLFNESEECFRKLFISSSDALFVSDAGGAEFFDANPRACQILGYSRRELLNLTPARILCAGERPFEWGCPTQKTHRDAFCRHKSGLLIPGEISLSPIRLNRSRCTLVSVRTNTQRQLAESLRRMFAFARFLNGLMLGVAEAPTIEHAIRFCIHQVCDFRCWPFAHAHIFAKRFSDANVPTDIWYLGLKLPSALHAKTMASKPGISSCGWYPRVITSGRPFIAEDLLAEADLAGKQLARSLGARSALVTPLLVGREVIGTLEFFSSEPMYMDKLLSEMMADLGGRVGRIVEQKHVQNQIESLSSKLLHVQDDERRRLAGELHDTTAQHIAAILMDLNVISRQAEVLGTNARAALSECMSLARQSLYEIRTFSYLLHPPMLDELGLISALRIYIEGFAERSGMRVNFEPPDTYNKLPAPVEVTLFHVVQEGLTNAHRHSGSSWATVRMVVNHAEIRMAVENETTGEFDAKNALQNPRMGVGMRSLHERVEHFGGRCTFYRDPYRTILEAVLPTAQAAQAAKA